MVAFSFFFELYVTGELKMKENNPDLLGESFR